MFLVLAYTSTQLFELLLPSPKYLGLWKGWNRFPFYRVLHFGRGDAFYLLCCGVYLLGRRELILLIYN